MNTGVCAAIITGENRSLVSRLGAALAITLHKRVPLSAEELGHGGESPMLLHMWLSFCCQP